MRYYGGKGKLVDLIYETAASLIEKECPTVFDVFAGTSIVARHFKANNFKVKANDILTFSYYRSVAYIELNEVPAFIALKVSGISCPIHFLNNYPGKCGFITNNYSPFGESDRQYLSVRNAEKVDGIREKIEEWYQAKLINFKEYCYLITCLIEAINLTSNVTGTYAAYLKKWDKRALNVIKLSHLKIVDNGCCNEAFNKDAIDLEYGSDVDICYLDPPYNSRQYTSNYFFLELIATGWFDNKPIPKGKTGMVSFTEKKSEFCSKAKAKNAFSTLIEKITSPIILLSYNNEGIIPHDEILEELSKYGSVEEKNTAHKRYRAINQDGSVTKTKESIFILQRK